MKVTFEIRRWWLKNTSPGGFIYFKPIWEGRGLFNIKKTMLSVLRKELEYKVREVGGHAAEDKKQIETASW